MKDALEFCAYCSKITFHKMNSQLPNYRLCRDCGKSFDKQKREKELKKNEIK